MQKIYAGVVVIIILVGAYVLVRQSVEEVVIPTPSESTEPDVTSHTEVTPSTPAAEVTPSTPATNGFAAQADIASKIHTVTFTGTTYEPKSITIKAGEGVEWVNESDIATWPASAMHPTHTVYPGSDIMKCGTSAAEVIFDACAPLKKDETFTFTFTQKGTWKYHDHMSAQHTGSITVE